MPRQQTTPMGYDPVTGKFITHVPNDATAYRTYHGALAWLYNPWTGKPRHPADIGTDVFGVLIVPPNEVVSADAESVDSGPYHDDAHPDRLLPVKYYTEGTTQYAVYGTSSITYVDVLREQVAALRSERERWKA